MAIDRFWGKECATRTNQSCMELRSWPRLSPACTPNQWSSNLPETVSLPKLKAVASKLLNTFLLPCNYKPNPKGLEVRLEILRVSLLCYLGSSPANLQRLGQ